MFVFAKSMKITRTFVVVLMAFTICAFVSLEDVRESDTVYGSSGVLRESRPELSGNRNHKLIESAELILKNELAVSAEATTQSATRLSFAACILRC